MAQTDRATILRRIRRMVAEVGGTSDAQLLERFATQHDETAFELLLWRHARLVFGVCQRVLHNEHDAEDAFQATFLALARHAGRMARKEAVAGWLHRVAHRAALALRMQRARRSAQERRHREAQHLATPATADAITENQELRQILDHEIARLPERFRAPVVLCYLEGKSVDEAAMRLGCPRGTVASQLARGRERLRFRLLQRGLTPGVALAGFTQAKGASIPVSLIPTLTAAALRYAAPGGAVDGIVSSRIAALTHEVLRAMFLHRLKTAVLLIAFLGVLLAGGGVSVALYAGGAPNAEPPGQAQPPETRQTKQTRASPGGNRPPVVTVSRPVQRQSAPYEIYTGRLKAFRAVEVRPAVSGTVEKICFKPGTDVKKGDVLFALDPRTFQLALDKAEAELTLAQAKNKRHEQEHELAKANPSVPDFDKVREQAAITEAQIRLAKIEVESARLQLTATQIAAPMSGQVGRALVELGSEVFHGPDRATLLTTISRLDPIGLTFEMDERSFLQYQRWLRERTDKKAGARCACR